MPTQEQKLKFNWHNIKYRALTDLPRSEAFEKKTKLPGKHVAALAYE
jgi:hypothetical protein